MKNIEITYTTKLAELVERNDRLLLVLDRFEIPLGFGDITIEEACKKYDVDQEVFLLIVKLFCNYRFINSELEKEEIIVNTELDKNQIYALIKYLKNAHNYYLNNKLPFVKELIMKFIENTENEHTELILNFFNEYEQDVNKHMEYENNVVFPYIEKLCGTNSSDKYNIEVFENNHTNIEDIPNDLKILLLKHFPPTKDKFYRNQILLSLYDLEYDLVEHGRIEDKVLIPLIKKLETEVNDD